MEVWVETQLGVDNDIDPLGRCHICEWNAPIRYCSLCNHWFCSSCRNAYWKRGLAAVKEVVNGRQSMDCCGPGEKI